VPPSSIAATTEKQVSNPATVAGFDHVPGAGVGVGVAEGAGRADGAADGTDGTDCEAMRLAPGEALPRTATGGAEDAGAAPGV
jgi:hypothetical protein